MSMNTEAVIAYDRRMILWSGEKRRDMYQCKPPGPPGRLASGAGVVCAGSAGVIV